MKKKARTVLLLGGVMLLALLVYHNVIDSRTITYDKAITEEYIQEHFDDMEDDIVFEKVYVINNYCVAVFSTGSIRGNGILVLKQHWLFSDKYYLIQVGISSQTPRLTNISNGIRDTHLFVVSGYKGGFESYKAQIYYQDGYCEEIIVPITDEVFCDVYFFEDDYGTVMIEYQ